jgi:hypothetical protein
MNRNPIQFLNLFRRFSRQRGALFTLIMFGALLAFEVFNYSTTDFALSDVLGPLTFMGVRWSTVLSIAFCGIDFAGIARLFTPEQGRDEPTEVWYLFGAWVLAAAMNATLTWWGVALALASHTPASVAILDRSTLNNIVPVMVAVMVWVIRILIIGTFSLAGDRLFWMDERRSGYRPQAQPTQSARPVMTPSVRPAASFSAQRTSRPEPTYQPLEPTYRPVINLAAKPKDHVDTLR